MYLVPVLVLRKNLPADNIVAILVSNEFVLDDLGGPVVFGSNCLRSLLNELIDILLRIGLNFPLLLFGLSDFLIEASRQFLAIGTIGF